MSKLVHNIAILYNTLLHFTKTNNSTTLYTTIHNSTTRFVLQQSAKHQQQFLHKFTTLNTSVPKKSLHTTLKNNLQNKQNKNETLQTTKNNTHTLHNI